MSKPGSFKTKLRSFIPRRVGNRVVAGFLGFSRALGRPFTVKGAKKTADNKTNILKHFSDIKRTNGYIEDQNSYTDVRYGAKTMQYSGCGVFAVYNALINLHGYPDYQDKMTSPVGDKIMINYSVPMSCAVMLSELILEFERNGIVFSGNLGTDPGAINKYFMKKGYETVISYKAADFDRIGEQFDTLILIMYNDRTDIMQNVHFINISKEKDMFTAHNVYCNGYVFPPKKSVTETIGSFYEGRSKGICLIGIRKKL